MAIYLCRMISTSSGLERGERTALASIAGVVAFHTLQSVSLGAVPTLSVGTRSKGLLIQIGTAPMIAGRSFKIDLHYV